MMVRMFANYENIEMNNDVLIVSNKKDYFEPNTFSSYPVPVIVDHECLQFHHYDKQDDTMLYTVCSEDIDSIY
ncbi:hypothetical protein Riggi_2 [Bacillus phage Riggi]|uniref:Uncharacterized protein n=1 Tax=Bacillus phage Riggi TaxID=2884426 RepID=U5PW63_9CAUD|nr:hypothetical protein Riggi_2 [Bacillus phage Riggi]AGY48164.1 hypothetical protein Riggi_2 [Bacillus phage Riggi]